MDKSLFTDLYNYTTPDKKKSNGKVKEGKAIPEDPVQKLELNDMGSYKEYVKLLIFFFN